MISTGDTWLDRLTTAVRRALWPATAVHHEHPVGPLDHSGTPMEQQEMGGAARKDAEMGAAEEIKQTADALAAVPADTGMEAVEDLRRAHELIEGRDPLAALHVLNESMQRNPDAIGLPARAATLLADLRRFDEADALLEAAQIRFPSEVSIFIHRARVAQVRRDWTAMAAHCQLINERFPENEWAYVGGGQALTELKQLPEAEAVIAAGLKQCPDSPELFGAYCWQAHHRLDWPEAAKRWQAFRDRFPDLAGGYAMGSIALRELERFDEADAVLLEGLQRHPANAELLGNYAGVAHTRQDLPEALKRWQAFHEKFPDDVVGYSIQGVVLREAGRYDEADTILLKGLQRYPTHPELLGNYAWVASKRLDWPEALKRWQAYRDLFPDQTLGHHQMMLALGKIRQLGEAATGTAQATVNNPSTFVATQTSRLIIPQTEATLAHPGLVCIEPPADWVCPAAEFVVDLSGAELEHSLLREQAYHHHGTYRDRFEDVTLFGHQHFNAVITSDGRICCQVTDFAQARVSLDAHIARHPHPDLPMPYITREGDEYRLNTSHIDERAIIDVSGSVYFATPVEPLNWAAWVFHGLPAAFDFAQNRPAERYLSYIDLDWLREVGIPDDALVRHELARTYRCSSVVFRRYSQIDVDPTAMDREIYERVGRKLAGPRAVAPNRRVFISRRSASGRILLNENELIDALAARGFEIVETELLSFVDKVRLFRDAELVVGLGGSGMFNVAFCRPGTRVVSIEGGNAIAHITSRFIGALGHRYGYILGKPEPTDPEPIHKRWTIDVQRAVAAIHLI